MEKKKAWEAPTPCQDKASIARMLAEAGLEAAGAAVFSLTRIKRAGKPEVATESAEEGRTDVEQGEESSG